MSQAIAALLGFLVLTGVIAYLGRYETASAGAGAVIVTDRWLGTVRLCTTVGDNFTVFCFPRFPPHKLPTAEDLIGPRPAHP